MEETAGRTGPNRAGEDRLKHACDAGMVSGEIPSDSEDSNNPLSSDSVSSESPPRLTDLAASFRVFSESMARMDLAEMEMIKAREASRLEAEKRRMELEAELTRIMLQTQLQIASVVAGKGTSRKRKRVAEEKEETPISSREGALLLKPSSDSWRSRCILPEVEDLLVLRLLSFVLELSSDATITKTCYRYDAIDMLNTARANMSAKEKEGKNGRCKLNILQKE
ncbi:unnamed protein product [Dovyalis caffra]|uniref:Uncharacterized protein n=1 Tax=Dovyalis caffra TaxID=77055 RepID=A0AAV1SIX5_9ROSI|nr:unnamed protein product [Dovyalis caffra]